MTKALKKRLARLETAGEKRRVWPVAWPSVEAAAAAGVQGGFIVVGEVLPPSEWTRLAVAYMRELVKGHRYSIH